MFILSFIKKTFTLLFCLILLNQVALCISKTKLHETFESCCMNTICNDPGLEETLKRVGLHKSCDSFCDGLAAACEESKDIADFVGRILDPF